MKFAMDARVPVVFGGLAEALPTDLLLVAGVAAPVGVENPVVLFTADGDVAHPAGCACCVPRGELSRRLLAALHQRARGQVAFFRRVLVVAGEAEGDAVRAALAGDAVLGGCFRVEG